MLRYLTGKIDGTLAPKMTQDADAIAPKTPDDKAKAKASVRTTVRMWACDVCKQAFPDYDEACRHEDQCRLDKQAQDLKRATHTNMFLSQSQAVVHMHSRPEPPPTQSQEWTCDVCQTQFADYDEACRHEDSCQNENKEAKAPPKPVHPFFQKEHKKQDNKSRKAATAVQQRTITSLDSSPEPVQEAEASKKRKEANQKQQKEPAKKMKPGESPNAKKQVSTKNQPLANIFSGSGADQILAEHRAAEFVAKRRAQAEQERERQKRRQANAQEKNKASKSPVETTLVIKNNKLRHHPPPAVRFPSPSHVGAEGPSDVLLADTTTTARIDQEILSKAQECLEKTPRHAGWSEIIFEQPTDCLGLLPADDDKPLDEMDPLQAALADLLIPPETASDGTVAWSDKYTIQKVPEDVCGEANREMANELVKFVQEWKVERQRAHERRAEKQRALLKSKKHKTRKYRDDDLWNDSDEDGGLCSVCLLTGPTGSGKTSLIHAIAAKSDCVVLEINTTEKRGGQALKNAIEEATQSESSLDMLKKSQTTFNADPFQDSDDEKETKGSSIIVILIDEGKCERLEYM
jgi:predicted HD phosphohydrolase